MIHDLRYYRDLLTLPLSNPVSSTYIPPSLPADTADYVAAGWFVDRLSSEWDLWSPFEEALIDLPTLDYRPRDKTNVNALRLLRENVLSFAYCMAVVMPWRKHPQKPAAMEGLECHAKTLAGSILWMMKDKLIKGWDIIDGMFDKDDHTVQAVEMILHTTSVKKARGFKEQYGRFWAAHVLCGMMFEWCELCRGQIEEDVLEAIWYQRESHWREVASAVDRARWHTKGRQ